MELKLIECLKLVKKILYIDIDSSHINAAINGNGNFLQEYKRENAPNPSLTKMVAFTLNNNIYPVNKRQGIKGGR